MDGDLIRTLHTQALIITFFAKNNTPYTQHLTNVIYRYLFVEKVTYVWFWKSCCVTRSERVNGWRLNPNITQALIPPIGLVLTWLDLFYSMWFLLGQMNGYGWPIYIAVKTSANLTNWDGLSLCFTTTWCYLHLSIVVPVGVSEIQKTYRYLGKKILDQEVTWSKILK